MTQIFSFNIEKNLILMNDSFTSQSLDLTRNKLKQLVNKIKRFDSNLLQAK